MWILWKVHQKVIIYPGMKWKKMCLILYVFCLSNEHGLTFHRKYVNFWYFN